MSSLAQGMPRALRFVVLSVAALGLSVAVAGLPFAAVALSRRPALRSMLRFSPSASAETPSRMSAGGSVGQTQSAAAAAPSFSDANQKRVFVDATIGESTCANYNPASRRCSGGDTTAFQSLAAAARAATAGTTVVLREGTYREQLAPTASGTTQAPIVFRAQEREKVVITGALDPAINLSNRQHVVVDHLIVQGVVGWVRAENTAFCVIQNCVFAEAGATDRRTGLTFLHANDNQVLSNSISGGYDNLLFIDSSRNVVQGNTISNGKHALWSVLCGDQNVIRRNILVNESQSIGRVADCSGEQEAPRRDNATHRNLIEANLFLMMSAREGDRPSAGLQYGGQDGIIRNNEFVATSGPGLQMMLDSGGARFNTHNRIFHNAFVASRLAGVELPGDCDGCEFSDNVFKNNILYANRVALSDERLPETATELRGKPVQLLAGRLSGFMMERNVIYGTMPSQPDVIAMTGHEKEMPRQGRTLADWQKAFSSVFRDNINVRPVFRDERRVLLWLANESALVDSGAFLARTTAAGSGTLLPVDDTRWFFDGFGFRGERGDEIQLEEDSRTVHVMRVDADARVLTLDQPLTWKARQGVSLRYAGRAPTVGLTEGMALESRYK